MLVFESTNEKEGAADLIVHEELELADVQRLERVRNANSVLGSYDMDKACPLEEFTHFKVSLETKDLDRVFLLGEFAKFTSEHSGRVKDIILDNLSRQSKSRVKQVFSPPIDSGLSVLELAGNFDFAIICVTTDLELGSLTVIDGNHRAIAYFAQEQGVEGLPAFVSVHPNICRWPFVPGLARE